jgi:hypothetical protein
MIAAAISNRMKPNVSSCISIVSNKCPEFEAFSWVSCVTRKSDGLTEDNNENKKREGQQVTYFL